MKQLIRDYRKLYRDYANGRLTEEQYAARLQELRKKHNTAEILKLNQ
jgi:hypothetical protein